MADPVRLDQVKAERIVWLWRQRIPKGMITVVAGRPDQGKGLFAAHVAADASRNGINVLYSAAEDSHSIMTRPRLEAAGANQKRILVWRFVLPSQMDELAQIVVQKKIGLIVIDPIASHLGSGVSRHSDNIRSVLDPLRDLIEKTGTAVLIIEHALKRVPATGHILQAIGGSGSGLVAFARAAYVFGVAPDDEDHRILAVAKFNIGDKPKAVAFEVDTVDLDEVGEVPCLVFDDELMAFDPMRLFQGSAKGSIGRPPDKRASAAEWLTNYLANAGKPVQSGKILEDAKQQGMAVKTLRRAAEDMAIVKDPPGGGRNCTWDLPDEVKDLLGIDTDPPGPPGITTDMDPDPSSDDGEMVLEPAPIDAELPDSDAFDQGLADLLKGTDGKA